MKTSRYSASYGSAADDAWLTRRDLLAPESAPDQPVRKLLRKPLAPHWALQSEFTDQGQDGSAAATFLEWFNRY